MQLLPGAQSAAGLVFKFLFNFLFPGDHRESLITSEHTQSSVFHTEAAEGTVILLPYPSPLAALAAQSHVLTVSSCQQPVLMKQLPGDFCELYLCS